MNREPELFESAVPECTEQFDPNKLTKGMVFELIRHIKDPEHPYSLEILNVVNLDSIEIKEISTTYGKNLQQVVVHFQPTIPHCSMAAIIGLCIFYVLKARLDTFWIRVQIAEDTHVNWKTINKQLDDKDRTNAAFENTSILNLIGDCIGPCSV
ncbi:hypothetical protein THOM_1678 [Trachipleistophora hominis]|uniref:Uncharacterized protein n=1 Tax=Trachipleistophora hominis TaxID=72359 RepID=L7JWF5_TRAHO|nr:hypothetical protein THOM_1678 [Trachipleistophora hominis]